MTESTENQEQLSTGWESDTPISDTWHRRSAFVLGSEMRDHVGALGGKAIEHPDMLGGVIDRPAAIVNGVTLLQPLDPKTLNESMNMMARELELDQPATGPVFVFSPVLTPDLTSFGWTLMGHPPAMMRPAGAPDFTDPAGIDIRRVETVDQLLEWERVSIDGFPIDFMQPVQERSLVADSMLDDPHFGHWLAFDGDQVVGAASASIHHDTNYVSFVATVPEARSRGVGTALTFRAALLDPELPALLFSTDEGRPVYERMGFMSLMRYTLWYRNRSTA